MNDEKKIVKPLAEGQEKNAGVNPPPTKSKPDNPPPGQGVILESPKSFIFGPTKIIWSNHCRKSKRYQRRDG